ncbi:hypothetical protein [Spirosoma daeguense]
MHIFKSILKRIRFYLVWLVALPFVLLYLIGAAIFSGQWRLIGVKLSLIHLSLRQKHLENRPTKLAKALRQKRIQNFIKGNA